MLYFSFLEGVLLMMESAAVQRSVAFMVGAVGVWWVANTIATIASKSVMRGGDDRRDETGFTAAFTDWRWVELTLLQHFVGALLAGIWVKATGKSIWPENARNHTMLMYIAALGNVVGNMSTNAAFSLVSSSTTQVIKACEPLFTFVLTLLLYRNYTALNVSTLLSVVIIVVGAGSFLMKDATFNIWGMVAAMISNTAFPTRNIFLKKLSDIWESPLQKFTVMSIYSTLLALPLWLVKVVAVSGFSSGKLPESIISSFFHSTYNLASITVLESVNPVTHAILNISKRLFVIMANVVYFQVPFSFHMFLSLVLLLVGCYLYQKSGTKMVTVMKCVLLAFFMVYLFFPMLSSPTRLTSSLVPLKRYPIPGNVAKLHPPGDVVPLLLATGSPALPPVATPHDNMGCNDLDQIFTAWVYDRPIPDGIVNNLQDLSAQNPGRTLYVYCGTSHCVNRIRNLKNNLIVAKFVSLPIILADLPLRGWLARHPFNKILAGIEFEDNVQDAVALGLLWRYGGFYINPRCRVAGHLSMPDCVMNTSAWVSNVRAKTELFSGAFFSRQHSLIRRLADIFVKEYPTAGSKSAPFPFNFKNKAWSLIKSCTNCSRLNENVLNLDTKMVSSSIHHYGTLTFERRVKKSKGSNLGDEVQEFPGLSYLPYRDTFLDRDGMMEYKAKENVTAFLNAWWADGSGDWPPPKTVHPLLVSIHLAGGMAEKWANHPEYLRERGPVGCRDLNTLNFLTEQGVAAYFSGCMTLHMPNPFVNLKRNDKIYIVDLNRDHRKLLPQKILKQAVTITHFRTGPKSMTSDVYKRFSTAYDLMKKYGEAKLVITQRIHCALPSVGMNTPVVFFNSGWLPGGGGTGKKVSSRAAGLTPLFHTVDSYLMTEKERKKWIAEFPWDNPPPNPNPAMHMRLRATAWNVIRKHQPLYDAGRKFGVIPMLPPIMTKQKEFVFHYLFATEVINQQQWRSIESVLYHHPTSDVVVHSNNLPQDTFDVLTEAGYLVKVANYNLEELMGSSAVGLLEHLEKEVTSSYEWFSCILRFLILHQQGGVYIDSDVILVQSIDTLMTSSMGWEKNANSTLSTAFMMFEKGHPFLKLCLDGLVKIYRSGDFTVSTSEIVTRVWHHYETGNDEANALHVLPYYSFYTVIHSSSMAQQCFEDTAGQAFNATIKIVTTKAYAVKLNSGFTTAPGSQLKEDSVCGYLLSNFCVLCSNIY